MTKKMNNKWTFEKCKVEALKYQFRMEFYNNSKSAYSAALKNGWLNEICNHMVKPEVKRKWTFETCKDEALKYLTRGKFQKQSASAYNAARKLGVLDEVCSHMEIQDNFKYRYIYAYEFNDNSVYVGLSWSLKSRASSHYTDPRSAIYELLVKKKEYFFACDFVKHDCEIAGELEKIAIEDYELNGWKILNRMQGGGLGTGLWKWDTKEKCHEEALKYNSRKDFNDLASGAYDAARMRGWLDDICDHMEELVKPKGYWDKSKCHVEALKYIYKRDFKNNSSGAAAFAYNNGFLDEICSHMTVPDIHNKVWHYQNCKEEALKYKSRSSFSAGSNSAFCAAVKNGWLDEFCSHMEYLVKPNNYWSKDKCLMVAKLCSSKVEFKKKYASAYRATISNGWLEEIGNHFERPRAFNKKWCYENCKEEALKYTSRSEFKKKASGAFKCAYLEGFLDEICEHMEKK